ncbi:chromosome segregation protein SMC [Salinisphaera sp. Q1T1-3]|uniref:chromosome segregation protein SMC n=1 Tax=Salinisphaera sp. Q1T1-3 TaxID=2321229 RepID=UPI0011C46972|nr:chromosome segregation protein SMC [Salinisphaera sp. Q1T1-3]
MRLTHIKLAGFKSFVDPTTLSLASNLTSVVGPNGCGKSNVIDAVRWVTGESSARQLRGEALEDVIFNGSHARKPVGRASVELKFDNSEGKLGGQYAAFAEIGVRRELTRDGASKYFINGTRARRRDVVDLFLGTGLGGRSNYAVIEQGAVNRLIEAKPEDMRQVLEEAAGISKYKERRRETENRIRHTRDNLDRLDDLIGEITTRLGTLKRQADNAEKYKTLKADERRLRAELLALKWQERSTEVTEAENALREVEARLREAISSRRAAQDKRDEATQTQRAAGETVQTAQAAFYDAQAGVGRIEQAMRHAREVSEMRQRERQSLVDRLETLGARRDADRQQDVELAETQETRRTERAAAEAARQSALETREMAESEAEAAERAWDELNNQQANPVQQLEAEKTRASYAAAERDKLADRQQRRQQERDGLPEIATERLTELADEVTRQKAALEAERASLADEQTRHDALRLEIDAGDQRLAEARTEHGERQAELAAERAMQQAVLREDDAGITEWLAAQGHGAPVGVARRVRIATEWRHAAEAALADLLRGFAVDTVASADSGAPTWPDERITLVDDTADTTAGAAAGSNDAAPAGLACLAGGIEGPAAVRRAAAAVFVAPDWATAAAARSALSAHQRIVTLDGAVLGAGHITTPPRETSAQAVFERETRIDDLAARVAVLEETVAAERDRVAEGNRTLSVLDESRREREGRIAEHRRALETAEAELEGQRLRVEQTQTRRAELDSELAELAEHLTEARAAAEAAESRTAALADDAARHTETREQTRTRLGQARRQRDDARQAAAGAERALADVDQSLSQLTTRRESLKLRLDETQSAFDGVKNDIARFDAETPQNAQDAGYDAADLEAAREARATADRELRSAREAHEATDTTLAEAGKALMQAEQHVEKTQEALGQARIAVETAATRRQGVVEQLSELGEAPAPIIERLPDEAAPPAWQREIERIEQRIARLGAINLAAIEEYDEAAERERYLAEQHADLTDALTTLESAIARIDKETRERFRTTYEQINRRFSEMFPQLFGGGEAALSLTEQDWLTTGVRVMARPPGKRNASIQMLSGGEKALTAVALLFALFELNPAPFCMLDEIDAPLDDANVSRFCELVRKMSTQVQFIVITHNKLTMELAEQLHGVTMAEPGVSRLVSVDIDAALDLAG